jgi:hypothetical protein
MPDEPKKCLYCDQKFLPKGLAHHQKACKRKADDEQDEARYMANRRLQQQGVQTGQTDRHMGNLLATASSSGSQLAPDFPALVMADVDAHDVPLHADATLPPHDSVSKPDFDGSVASTNMHQLHPVAAASTDELDADSETSSESDSDAGDDVNDAGSDCTDPHDFNDGDDPGGDNPDGDSPDTGSQSHLAADPCDLGGGSGSSGDIKVKYHPSSGRPAQTFTFGEFQRAPPKLDRTDKLDHEPWAPFRTREDFEFAALMQRVKASKKDVDKLIHLFKKCINDKGGSFTLSNHKEMCETLTLASKQLPEVMFQILHVH